MKNRFFAAIGILFCLCSSCSDIITKDISNGSIVIIAPADNDTSTSFSQMFWWEELEGATAYHLQVVKPSFSNIQQLALDTTISSDRFAFTLQPGTYQWRVRGENNAGYTPYTVHTLTIDSTLDLTSQTVQLVSPVNNAVVNNLTQTYRWYNMPFADSYTFQVLTQSSSVIYINSTIVADSIVYTLPSYGTYKWRVWAQNASSISHYSEHTITTNLSGSTPSLPVNNDTVPSPVYMSWMRPFGVAGDSLFIYQDILMSTQVYSGYQTATTYSFTGGAPGQDYYWRLRSKDNSGNMSGYSALYKFTVDP